MGRLRVVDIPSYLNGVLIIAHNGICFARRIIRAAIFCVKYALVNGIGGLIFVSVFCCAFFLAYGADFN